MYRVVYDEVEEEFENLDLAMKYAKSVSEFVTIKGGEFEVVGKFGVDSIIDGICPDGIEYSWKKRRP